MNRSILVAIGLLSLFGAPGCMDSSQIAATPISGSVMLDGELIDEAQVVFHAAKEMLDLPHKPIGVTDTSGSFQLTTAQPNDGAPTGEYVVTVEKRELKQIGEEYVRGGKNLLPARYSSPKTSPLRYVVTETETAPLRLELTRK